MKTVTLFVGLLSLGFGSAAQLNWTRASSPNVGYGNGILGSPTGQIYALGSTGIAVSSDNGASWVRLSDPTWGETPVWRIALNAYHEPVVAVGGTLFGNPGSLWVRRAGVWHKSATDYPNTKGYWSGICNGQGNTLLACTQNSDVYRSSDYGLSFQRCAINVVPSQGSPWVIAKSPDGTIWMAGEFYSGIWRSSDNGSNWVNAGLSTATGWQHNIFAIGFTAAGETLATKDKGAYGIEVLRNGIWTLLGNGIAPYKTSTCITVHPTTGTIYLGQAASVNDKRNVWQSTDSGKSWTSATYGLSGLSIAGLSVNPLDGHLLLMEGSDSSPAIVYSAAGGGSTPPPTLASIVVSPSSVALRPNATQQFSASGIGTDGKPYPLGQVQWKTETGAITSTGLLTAGGTLGTYHVSATYSGVTGTATVKVEN